MPPQLVIRIVLGLLGLISLAYVAGHPRLQEWEAKLGISQVITAGFPFVVLGAVARHPSVGILAEPVLDHLGTLLGFALGWIGLVAGFRFDARLVSGLPRGAGRTVALATSIPFVFVLGLTGIVLVFVSGGAAGPTLRNPAFVRDAVILGTAGAMTAKTSARLLRSAESAGTLSRVIRIEELAGVLGLAFVGAYFRPQAAVSWQLPGAGWFLLTIGLGATIGLVTYAMLQYTRQGRPEFVVLTLGSVSFAAGVAGYLRLSPIVLTFIAGVLLANMPGTYHSRLGSALRRLERPVYLLSLVVIGALWQMNDWRGWVLMPVFVSARLIGKHVAARLVSQGQGLGLGTEERDALAIAPMGPLAIAIVVNAQLLYPGGSISLIASAVIGGAIATELIVQVMTRHRRSRPQPELAAAAAPAAEPAERDALAREATR